MRARRACKIIRDNEDLNWSLLRWKYSGYLLCTVRFCYVSFSLGNKVRMVAYCRNNSYAQSVSTIAQFRETERAISIIQREYSAIRSDVWDRESYSRLKVSSVLRSAWRRAGYIKVSLSRSRTCRASSHLRSEMSAKNWLQGGSSFFNRCYHLICIVRPGGVSALFWNSILSNKIVNMQV